MKPIRTIRIYQNYIKLGVAAILVLAIFAVLEKSISVAGIFQAGGIGLMAATIFAETGLLAGFFLPGDTLLFAAGFFAAEGKLDIGVTLVALFAGAVLGNMMGYEIGRRSGPRLFNKPDSIFLHKDNIERARTFFNVHGGKTVVFARFIPIIRTMSSPLAGMGHMRYLKFLAYNIVGALIWVPLVTMIGYWAGKVLGHYINIDRYILPAVLLATLLTFGISLWHLLKDPLSRERFGQKLAKLKKEV